MNRHTVLRSVVASPFLLLWLFSTVPFAPGVNAAERIDVPLAVPLAYLEARAAAELGLGPLGEGELQSDACKRLELSNLEIRSEDAQLVLYMDVRAHAGLSLLGRCRGPEPLDARLQMRLLPSAGEEGGAVLFTATEAQLSRRDGSASVFTAPSRMLADALLLPRLSAMRVDIHESLADIDALIVRFMGDFPEGTTPLAQSGEISAVATGARGLELLLAFSLVPRPAGGDTVVAAADSAGAPIPPNPNSDPLGTAVDLQEQRQWQRVEDELDGFLTVVVAQLAAQTADRDLQLDFLSLLIDGRSRISDLVYRDALPPADADVPSHGAPVSFADDPVRSLFLDIWAQLSDLALRLPRSDTGSSSGLRLAGFLAAGDALQLADSLGPGYGIEISRDGLRRLARMLLADQAPAAFTPLPLDTDPALQKLFGFGGELPKPARMPPSAGSAPPPLGWLRLLNPVARVWAAQPAPAELLRDVFPEAASLDNYLSIVAELIAQSLDEHWNDSRLSAEQRALFEPLVRATAWKETCWRHFVPGDAEPEVIKSPVGAVGMMQIVGRVWRSLFDLERLETDVDYNVGAGIDILEHYFLDYAVRRGEDRQPGGKDNLVRATYAAYNAGPSRLNRYRNASVSARARDVDEQFYAQYLVMREEPWPRVSRCYK